MHLVDTGTTFNITGVELLNGLSPVVGIYSFIEQKRNVCDFMLVRGNVNTVRVLYYSNFLIKAKHGKKELDD